MDYVTIPHTEYNNKTHTIFNDAQNIRAKKNTLDKHLSHSFVVFFLFVFALGLVNGSNQPAIQHTEHSPNTFSPAATYGIVRRMDGKQKRKEDF